MDRLTKPAIYAEAGVGYFWRMELSEAGPTVTAYRLHEGAWAVMAEVGPSQDLVVEEPFAIRVRPGALSGVA